MTNLVLYSKDASFTSVLEEQISSLGNVRSLCDLETLQVDNDSILIIDFLSVSETPQELTALLQKNLIVLAIVPKEYKHLQNAEYFREIFSTPLRLGYFMDRLEYYVNKHPLLKKTTLDLEKIVLESKNKSIHLKENPMTAIKLTEKEFALIELLATNNAPMQRQDILNKIWGYDERIETKTLETHIYQLRKKLEKLGMLNYLLTNNGLYFLSNNRDTENENV